MAISKIQSRISTFEAGKAGVTKIELTNHGNDKTSIYKIDRENDEPLYVGMLRHEVEYQEDSQMTMFDFL